MRSKNDRTRTAGAETCCEKPAKAIRPARPTGRIVALDRARTFITLLVVIHHSVVNYTHFGNGDKMRWLGFDLVVLFNDSFFMAFMFLISGLFVHDSLTRNGAGGFLRHRAWRLGIPLLVSIFVLIPIAYYASFLRYHHARHDRLQLLPLLGAYDHHRAMAVGTVMVPVGAARVRRHCRRDLDHSAENPEHVRPSDRRASQPADDGLCGLCRRLGRVLFADASVGSATAPGSSRAITRFRSKPAGSCSIPPISSPVSASA